eukprot:5177998-Alexandrium_andersonii.AAC.1
MSASLVGSEMCIRDRLLRLLGRVAVAEGLGHALRGYERKWRTDSGRVPVSYTHLTLPTICSV